MLFINPTCTQPTVLQAAEISKATLQTWANRGLAEADDNAPGKGKPRRYSYRKVAEIALMAELVRAGMRPRHAHDVAAAMMLGRARLPTWVVVKLGQYGHEYQAYEALDGTALGEMSGGVPRTIIAVQGAELEGRVATAFETADV
jgi:hypothetical protein